VVGLQAPTVRVSIRSSTLAGGLQVASSSLEGFEVVPGAQGADIQRLTPVSGTAPTTISAVTFDDVTCNFIVLLKARVSGLFDIETAKVKRIVLISSSVEDFELRSVEFTPYTEAPILFRHARIRGRFVADWSEVPALHVASPRDWQTIADALDRGGQTDQRNEVLYRMEASRQQPTLVGKVRAQFSDRLWGYGYRPLRITLWIGMIVLISAVVYMSAIPQRQNRGRSVLVAIQFSLRTAISPTYGYAHATGWYRILAVSESIIVKLLALLFVQSLATVSPLLRELVSKLIPL
jgi:hypothetical protein